MPLSLWRSLRAIVPGVTWLNVLPFSIISTMASHRCSIRRHSCAKPVVKSI